jgi:hypothetical protein
MYLFSRSRVAHPAHSTDALGFAAEIATKATQSSGVQIDAWASVLSPDAGTIVWTAWFEHLADWEMAGDKLSTDAVYLDMIKQADHMFTGAVTDSLATIISGALDPNAPPASYVAVVNAVCANGQIAAAMQQGVAIAEAATRISGMTTMFAVSNTGSYGGVAWFTGAPDIATLEAGEHAVNSDPSFIELVDSGGALFQNGAAQSMFRRIG